MSEVLERAYRCPTPLLAVYRIFIGMFLLWSASPDLRWIGSLPRSVYNPPPGLPEVWGSFPPTAFLWGLELLGIGLFVALTLGWRTPAVSVGVAVWGVVTNSLVFSLGKIDHSILLWVLVAAMAGSGWGEQLSLDARRRPIGARMAPSWPLGLTSLIVGFGFLTAAVPKIRGGWLSPTSQATRAFFESFYIQLGRTRLLSGAAFELDVAWAWELLDVATILLEFGVVFLVLAPSVLRKGIGVLVAFHVSVLLVLNIAFTTQVIVYIGLLLPAVSPRAASRCVEFTQRRLAAIFGFALAFAAVGLFGRRPDTLVLERLFGFGPFGVSAVTFAIVSAVASAVFVSQWQPSTNAMRMRFGRRQTA